MSTSNFVVAAAPPPWRLQVLGQLRASRGDRRIERFPTRKTGALLACLALEPGRRHAREVLIEAFWPDAAPEAGRNSLSQGLSGLRRILEGPTAPGTVLMADRFEVALVPGAVTSDAAELRAIWRECRRLEPPSAAHRAALERAAGLYRGELLPGVDGDWVTGEREELARMHLDLLASLVQRLIDDGDGEQAVVLARRAVEVEPLREPAHRDLLRALAAAGRRAEALRHYQALERLLADELGVAPDDESRALAEGLRAEGPAPGSGETEESGPPPEPWRAASVLPAGPVTVLALRLQRDGVGTEPVAGYLRALGRRLRALDGVVLRPGVDETLAAFAHEADAIAAALMALRLARHTGGLAATAGLHAGRIERPAEAEASLGPVARRLSEVAETGQVLLSEELALRVGPVLEADDRLVDLGLYRLSPAADPERVFLLGHGGGPLGERAPLTIAPVRRSRLPVRLSRFVGREEERRRLVDLVCRPETRLVTITGMGGTGKTRLALEVARAWEARRESSACWVDLSTVTDAREVERAVAGALGPSVPAADAAITAIGSALGDAPSLLVLDNLEQLVPAASPWVGQLLSACPSVTVLVTSRLRLGIEGEQEYDLRPLPIPDVAAWLADLAQVPSVQLFVDRTRAGDPDFRLTAANAADVAQLCVALEGIPLAIELAAARVGVLSPRQMLERLNSRLAWLAVKRADLSERQRSLRGTIDWSHDLLDAQTRADFAAVAVFAGSWDIAAAEAVLDDDLALERMAELRDASLVLGDTSDDGVRYGMLEVVRLYAAEQLDPVCERELRSRHARHFADRAEAAAPRLTGPDQRVWLDHLARDHENFMAALAWCAGQPDEVATGLRLATNLDYYWFTRGHLRAGLEATAGLLAAPGADADPALEARALRVAGGLATLLDEVEAAGQYLERALTLQRATEDQWGTLVTAYQLAVLAHKRGDDARARDLAAESAARSRALGGERSLRPLAAALNLLGVLDVVAGDLVGARASLDESLAIVRGFGDRQGIANVLDNLVEIELRTGELVAAAGHAREMAGLAGAVGSHWMVLKAVGHLAVIEHRQGDAARAARLLGAADAQCAGLDAALTAEIRAVTDRYEPELRVALGDAALDAAWQAGQAQAWPEVLAELGVLTRPPREEEPAASAAS